MSSKKITKNTNSSNTKSIEEQFKKKTLHEHILDPNTAETYIGSIHNDIINIYVYDDLENKIVRKDKQIVLGLYKIFDEVLVNAADNTVRDNKCNKIEVNINQELGEISVCNNGSTIPIEIHKEYNIYVPELIFGNLLTSGNYDQKGKTIGGKNGFGSKLANIYSTRFDVEICDPIRKKKYFQRFSNNMFDKEEPIITTISANAESYTKITFVPDYKKFQLKNLTDDIVSLIKRRVYDIAGTTNSNVNVWLNGVYLDIKSFKDYIQMYYSEENMPDVIYEEFNERWTVGIVYDPNAGFQHMSFANKISTFKGGSHLNYVANQIVDKVIENIISQPKYKTLKIKPHQIKENLTIFINSVIEDPSFSSQSKEELTTKASLFNVKCELNDKFIAKICKTGLVNEIVQIAQIKQLGELEKSDGKKNGNLKSLTKLDDARLAGSKRSSECRLILTEGDSAKTCAISGLEVIGRDLFGVFPLKGKLLNVRDATPNQLLSNEEIKNIKQIMGLKQNTVYNDTKKLRYGGIIILTDADVDGSHIKGLLMNFFHYFWPSLLKIEGFVQSLATPIIKAHKNSDTKKQNAKSFHTLTEYKKWCLEEGGDEEVNKKYKIKYYKGLGTSTAVESKEYFNDFTNKLVNYVWSLGTNSKLINTKSDLYEHLSGGNGIDGVDNDNDNGVDNDNDNDTISSKSSKSLKKIKSAKSAKKNVPDDDENFDNVSIGTGSDKSEEFDKNDLSYQALTLAFAKNRSNDRKEWVRQRNENLIIENNVKKIPIYDFINKDLIHFSHDDNLRSLPDLVDGLKPSQRKILYGSFKRKLDNEEIKVAQLSGYISEHTGYHHGEASLQGAIINMAQDFCGSNNINLLYPSGNFGTRRLGGKDAASPRYIFTQLAGLTRQLFIHKDEPVLEQVIEEGDMVEPTRFYPIIPMLLVNGSEGIGTGFSTFIPPYNPLDLISNLKAYLNGTHVDKLPELTPWFSGFIGKTEKTVDKKNQIKYKTSGIYEQIDEYTLKITELPIGVWTQTYIDFLAKLVESGDMLTDYENNCGNHKINFKLYFKNGELQKLIKSKSIEERLKLTSSVQISNMHVYKNNEIRKYSNPNQILKDYIEIRLGFYGKRKQHYIKVLENELNLLKYRRKFILAVISNQLIISKKQKSVLIDELAELNYPQLSSNINSKPSYDYLVGMPMWSLTQEKIDELDDDFNSKKDELELYKKTTLEELWLGELETFENSYLKWHEIKLNILNETTTKKIKSSKSSKSSDLGQKEKDKKSKLTVKTK
jgi:DNA topoisomerase-2